MAWRLAKSLSVLRTEILARYPGTTVWTIGDQAHASGYSDHNPNSKGVVCAIDVKGDGGMSLQAFVDHLIKHPHPNLRYVIYNRRIYQRKNGFRAQVYTGPNAHADHAHASAGDGPDGRSTGGYDNTSPWGIATMGKPAAPATLTVPAPALRENDTGTRIGQLQRALNEALGLKLVVDEDYGPATTTAVRALQRLARITEDGRYGDDSAAALKRLLEDDMPTAKEVALEVWRYKNEPITRRDAYAQLLNADGVLALQSTLAAQTALIKQLASAQSGLTAEQISAAVADGVRQAIPSPEALAAAVAAAVDHDLDVAAAAEALREVLGSLDGAGA